MRPLTGHKPRFTQFSLTAEKVSSYLEMEVLNNTNLSLQIGEKYLVPRCRLKMFLPLKQEVTSPLKALLDCPDDIKSWMALNVLSLNEQKTEVGLFRASDIHSFFRGDPGPLESLKKLCRKPGADF